MCQLPFLSQKFRSNLFHEPLYKNEHDFENENRKDTQSEFKWNDSIQYTIIICNL
jgi:hypothetical protein